MRKKRNLQSLETLAHGRESRWQRHVAGQLQSLQTEEERLRQLHSYVADYQAPLTESRGGQSIMAMRSQRMFVDRLRQAVDQQAQTVAGKRAAAEQGMQRWKQERSKRLAIQKYGERCQEEAERQRERRSQAQLDEVGRNAFLRRNT